MRLVFLLVVALGLGACVPPPPPPPKFQTGTGAALLVIEAEPPGPLQPRYGYDLHVARYSPDERTVEDRGVGFPRMGDQQAGRAFYATRVPPGTYVLQKVTSQAWWNVCFNGGTKRFEVGPNEVVFLGRLEAHKHMAEMMRLPFVTKSGEMQTVFDTPRPAVTPPSELPGWETAVGGWVASTYPGMTMSVRPAEYSDATFKVGNGLLTTLGTICGGHWNRRDRAGAAAPAAR